MQSTLKQYQMDCPPMPSNQPIECQNGMLLSQQDENKSTTVTCAKRLVQMQPESHWHFQLKAGHTSGATAIGTSEDALATKPVLRALRYHPT